MQLKTPPKLTCITSSQSLGLHVVDQRVLRDAGVVDEDVQAAELRRPSAGRSFSRLRRSRRRRPGWRRPCRPSASIARDDLLGLLRARAVVHADRRALGGEQLGHRAADSPRAAGDQCDLVVELRQTASILTRSRAGVSTARGRLPRLRGTGRVTLGVVMAPGLRRRLVALYAVMAVAVAVVTIVVDLGRARTATRSPRSPAATTRSGENACLGREVRRQAVGPVRQPRQRRRGRSAGSSSSTRAS